MINRIIDFCANNRFIVFLFVGASVAAGIYSMRHITLDAIPDLSDTQVIIYSKWDRSPDIMEDQVTYPLITAMLGVPKVRTYEAFPISAILSYMSFSKTGPTSIGQGPGHWNI